jgi:sugar phosphate isomerase/epimerase
VAWTIDDLRKLPQYDTEGRLRVTLEQHEDLKSDELVHIVNAVANPNLSLLFDFANMVNAYERPLDALARQAQHITEVHVKDCLIQADRGGWAHLACASGQGHLPMHAMLVELLLLGADKPRVRDFGLEEGYFAPALRWPGQGEGPFIAARTESFTEVGSSNLDIRLRREAAAAAEQVRTIRAMLDEIATEARRKSRPEGGND